MTRAIPCGLCLLGALAFAISAEHASAVSFGFGTGCVVVACVVVAARRG